MAHNNASSPNTQALNTKNTKKFASHIGRGFYFSIPVATAALCWFNFNRSALATSIDSQVQSKTINPIGFSSVDNHESEGDRGHSGFLPRILSSIVSIFGTDTKALPEGGLSAKEPQTIFNSEAIGGSFAQDLVPMYLSEADSLSRHKFSLSNKTETLVAIDGAIEPRAKSNNEFLYTVRAGDTITGIAEKHEVSRQELIALNKINNSNVIFINQKLRVPSPNSNRVKAETEKITLTKANFPQNSEEQVDISARELQERRLANLRADINRMRSQMELERTPMSTTDDGEHENLVSSVDSSTDRSLDSISGEPISLKLPPLASSEEYLPEAFDGGYSWPARGVLSSGYGWRWGRLHKGIDIAAPVGTPIFAAASGRVISAGWNSGGYGNLVKIKHLDGSITLYAHNHRILVSNGQRVTRGEQIAEMGNTGFSTGSHLHFEIHTGNRGVVNPLALLARK